MNLPCHSTWPHVYHDVKCLFFLTFFTHSSHIFHACFFFVYNDAVRFSCYQHLECLCQICHRSISVCSKIHHTLYLNVILITASGVQAGEGSPLEESVGGLTLFRSHLSKFLSAVGRIFQIFCPLEVRFFKFKSVLIQVILFVCFRAIKIR